jgi:hypothetical protein
MRFEKRVAGVEYCRKKEKQEVICKKQFVIHSA